MRPPGRFEGSTRSQVPPSTASAAGKPAAGGAGRSAARLNLLPRWQLITVRQQACCRCTSRPSTTRRAPAGGTRCLTCLTTPPHLPAWCLRRLGTLLRTPERSRSSSEARRGACSPSRAIPKSRTVCLPSPGLRRGAALARRGEARQDRRLARLAGASSRTYAPQPTPGSGAYRRAPAVSGGLPLTARSARRCPRAS